MRIGICSPITIGEFLNELYEGDRSRARKVSGLFAPSVDAVVHEFLRMGHRVVVFTLDRAIKVPMRFEGERLTLHVGPYRSSARKRGLTFFGKEIRYLRTVIAGEQMDVIHAHWTYEFALGAVVAQCPVFCTVRDVAQEILRLNPNGYRFVRLLMNEWLFLRYGSRVCFIANSDYTARLLARWHRRVKTVIVPNPVGVKPLPREPSEHPIIATISNGWSPRKNILTLLKAFRIVKLNMPETELIMIGGEFSDSNATVRRLRSEADLLDDVTLAGAVPHDELPRVLSRTTLMVHPSLEESFGNTLIEAMACDVPVLGGERSGAVPWVLDNGRAGSLCDVSDFKLLADRILELLRDDGLRERLAAAGRVRAETVFSAQAVARQTLALYNKVCCV